jgi:L-ascorbate metabolism protein UlaG (beta-lactamase superfamily)
MGFELTWYGHAALQLKTGGYTILVDPLITDNPVAPVNADQLNPDFILLSHGHGDHLGDTVSIAKRTGAMVITNHEINNWLSAKGLKTHAQHIGGGYQHPFGYLKFTQALHGSGLPDGSCGGSPVGFLLTTLEGKKIYLACDTGLFSDMRLIGEEGIDLAAIPIGDNFTMGPGDALKAVKLLNPKHVLPIHYNTWELIKQDANAWGSQVTRETQAIVHILKPGEMITL